MTVLRSRIVSPAIGEKTSQLIASAKGVIESVTPSKIIEPQNHMTESTSSISSLPQPMASLSGSGRRGRSNRVVGTDIVRRSPRLAMKMVANEPEDNAEVVTKGKRKKVDSESDWDFSSSEVNTGSLEVGVSGTCMLAEKSTPRIMKNRGDVSVNISCSDRVEDRGTTVNGRKQKRKLGTDVKLLVLDSMGNDGLEMGVFNLRSGKKVVKREMEEDYVSDGRLFQKLENHKECQIMSSDDAFENDGSVADMDEDGNDCNKGRKFTRAEKGKEKIGGQSDVMRGSASVNALAGDVVKLLTLGNSKSDASGLLKSSDPEVIAKDRGLIGVESGKRLSREEKGKMKYEGEGSPSNDNMNREDKMLTSVGIPGPNQSVASTAFQGDIHVRETVALNDGRPTHRERHRNIARRIASRFAHFSSQDEFGDHVADISAREIPVQEADAGIEDWPGPFSTAMKIIKDRESNRDGKWQVASPNKSEVTDLKWIPVKQDQCKRPKQLIPSLQDLCLSVLAKNAESITSLECVPDMLRHKICWFLCDCRRMSSDLLKLLVHGSPTEIRLRDCSWLSDEMFVKMFSDFNLDNLTVLQFDQCGPCIPDYVLSSTLTRSPQCLSALTTLSLKGAYRLTDEGLEMLVSSAPNLKSVDLSQCSMLTSVGICSLANSLTSVLMELYMDNCDRIDAMLILPALLMLQKLEVLSLAGSQTVTDDFVSKAVSVHGCRMKEIVLTDCMELTDLSLEAIGDMCPGLLALDLRNLGKLTDVGICHIANGCREIQMLKLSRNAFSDEAVAAYLDIRGASLKELSLNNVIKVSSNTALSLARNCRNLQSLDVSWCRKLTNEALGLIVDTCTSLEMLKLFGCTQITSVFLDGYSNPRVKLIGLKLTSVVQHIDVPDFLHGPLRYSSA